MIGARGRRPLARLLAASTLALAGLPAAVAADSVSGAFQHSERGPIEPTYVAAFPVRASWDPDQRGIQVMLTKAEIDAVAAAEDVDPGTQVINQEALRGTDYLVLYVWDDGTVAVNGTYDRGNAQFILNSRFGLKHEITARSDDRIAARVWSDPVETNDGDETYGMDVTFDTAITRPPAAEPLPAGGGEPGAALVKLAEAVLAGDWQRLKPLLSEQQLAEVENGWAESDEERVEEAAGSLHTWVVGFSGEPATSVTVVGGSLREDGIADLDVRVVREGNTYLCQARMMPADDSGWHFDFMRLVSIE